jgi:hypothetical protein
VAIALRATNGGTTSAAGTLVVTVPAGTAAGDVLIIGVQVSLSGSVPATPAGLTFISGASAGPSFGSWYRLCDGTEPASYSFTVAQGSAGTARTYSGVDTVTPINAQATPARTAASVTATSTTITPTVNNSVLVFMSGITATSGTTITNPAGFANQRLDAGSTGACAASCDQTQSVAAATGAEAATWSVSGNNYAQLVALAPLAAPGGGSPPRRLDISAEVSI